MKPLPHLYKACISGTSGETLVLSADGLPSFDVAPPKEFGGPGDLWSPEELLLGAVANCLALTFRAIAGGSDLEWISIECTSEGKLERVDKKISFTEITSTIKLIIPANESIEKAESVIEKADANCLISNSLTAKSILISDVTHP